MKEAGIKLQGTRYTLNKICLPGQQEMASQKVSQAFVLMQRSRFTFLLTQCMSNNTWNSGMDLFFILQLVTGCILTPCHTPQAYNFRADAEITYHTSQGAKTRSATRGKKTKPISCYVLSEVTQAKIFTLSNSLCDIFSYAVFFSRMLGQMKMILCEIILDKVWKSFNLSKTLEMF